MFLSGGFGPSSSHDQAYLDTAPGCLGIGKANAHHSLGLLIVENNVGHIPQLRALIPNIFLDIKNGRRILLHQTLVPFTNHS